MLALFTFTPLYCPACGSHADLYGRRLEEFENHKITFCVNCGQKWQKLTQEVAIESAKQLGSDVEQWYE